MHGKKRFFTYIILPLSVAALIFSGCSFRLPENFTNNHSGDFGEDSKTVDSQNQVEDSEEFNAFLDELYASEMSDSDTLSIHYAMVHPENYGVEVPKEVTWGSTEMPGEEEITEMLTSLQDELTKYDYDSLSEEQQIIYDTLNVYIETELIGCKFPDYYEIFSPMSGLQTQIPLILSEYDFYTQEDIEDYLSLVEQSYDYIADCLEYEKERAEKGYFLADTSVEEVQEQCQEFLAPEENCLIPVFNEKLENFESLSPEEIIDYQERHEEALNSSLLPAYELMITELSALKGTRSENLGVCSYENGKEYYEYLVRSTTGSDKSVEELIDMTEKQLSVYLLRIQSAISSNPDLYYMLDDYEYPYSEPEDILEHLKEALADDFPEAAYDSYTLKYVAESLEDLSNPAFYMIPPIDDMEKEVIYINNSEEYAHMDLFPVLAHEGFPGHLYQNTYFNSLEPHPVRSLLGPTGYHEGWAEYVEIFSYQYSGLEKDLAAVLAMDSAFSYGLSTRIDMGIHYEGWNLSDTQDYCSDYGIDAEAAEEVFNLLIDEPCSYLPYYIGYLEIRELRDTMEEELGDDYSAKAFHESFLTIGPTYFDIIEKYMMD